MAWNSRNYTLFDKMKLKQYRWRRTLKLTGARWVETAGDERAATFAFYLLLSLLPLILLLVTAGSVFVEREVAAQAVANVARHYIPLTDEQEREAVSAIHGMLDTNAPISLAALPLLLWGSLKFLRTLIRNSNRIWNSPSYNWWQLPLRSLGLLAITTSAIMIGILVPGLARLVRSWLAAHLDFSPWAFSLVFQIIPWLVLFYGLLMIYWVSPSRTTKFTDVWLGAVGATALIWLGQRLFLFYVTTVEPFNVLYGTLGGIVAFLIWLYLSSCVAVLGICFCAAQAEAKTDASIDPGDEANQ